MHQQYDGWHKSSYSAGQDNCVEEGRSGTGSVGVRDTKDNGVGPVLEFAPDAWAAFLEDLRASNRLTGGHI